MKWMLTSTVIRRLSNALAKLFLFSPFLETSFEYMSAVENPSSLKVLEAMNAANRFPHTILPSSKVTFAQKLNQVHEKYFSMDT
ncbi:MAG: hypothetical protein IPL23_25655 [Saprospiraceae bacterium]|nr:hypothetical protein [Saprospiraceae bacterium]